MPIKRYTPEEIIKLLSLVEIETGQWKTTGQACDESHVLVSPEFG